jgi:hypothetical protein
MHLSRQGYTRGDVRAIGAEDPRFSPNSANPHGHGRAARVFCESWRSSAAAGDPLKTRPVSRQRRLWATFGTPKPAAMQELFPLTLAGLLQNMGRREAL